MRLTIFLFCLAYTQNLASKTFHSQKDGNFDVPSTWLENEAPVFKKDTIFISHSIYLNRSNEVLGNQYQYTDYNALIKIKRDGVLCILGKQYRIYSIDFDIEGQLYCRGTKFNNSYFNVLGYFVGDKEVTLSDCGVKFRGIGMALINDDIEFNCSRVSNELITRDTSCDVVSFIVTDSSIQYDMAKIICFSNRLIKLTYVIDDSTINSSSDSFFIYKFGSNDTVSISVSAEDSCGQKYDYFVKIRNYFKSSSVIKTLALERFKLHLIKNGIYNLISNSPSIEKRMELYDIKGNRFFNYMFKDSIELDVSDFPKGIYLVYVFDINGRVEFASKLSN